MNCFRNGSLAALTALAVAAGGVAPATASPSEIAPGVYDYAIQNGRAICRTIQSASDTQSGYILARLNVAVGLVGVPGVDSYSDPDEVAQVMDLATYTYCPSLHS